MTPSKQVVENFKQLYKTLNRETLTFERLSQVYSDDIIFEDCFHHIDGIGSLFEYFDNLYENVRYIYFDFENHWISEESAMLTWTMSYQPLPSKAQANSILNREKWFVIVTILTAVPCCMSTYQF